MFENDVVILTGAEMSAAANVGIARRIMSIMGKYDTKKHDETKGPWENDIVGAITEFAVAKYFNLHWTGAVIGNGPDVGGLIEVRAVWGETHRLLFRVDDVPKKEMPFVSVYQKDNVYKLRGWLFGHETMQQKWLDDPTDKGREECYCVDNAALAPMRSLRDWVQINRPKLWK